MDPVLDAAWHDFFVARAMLMADVAGGHYVLAFGILASFAIALVKGGGRPTAHPFLMGRW